MNITHCTGVADSSRKSRIIRTIRSAEASPAPFDSPACSDCGDPATGQGAPCSSARPASAAGTVWALGSLSGSELFQASKAAASIASSSGMTSRPSERALRRSREITSQITGRKADRHDVAAEVLDPFLGRFERRDPSDESEGRPLVGLVEKSFRVKRDLRPVNILPGRPISSKILIWQQIL